jgi:hypothetical protein
MNQRATDPVKLTIFFLLPFLATMIILILLAITWEKRDIEEEQVSELEEVAEAIYEQVMATRLWNAMHGGLYAEVTPDCQPNPFLDVEDRDITTTTGKDYTLINSAYMTRQLSDISKKKGHYNLRLVGLQPLNPENAPDRWERDALISFEESRSTEAVTFLKDDDGDRYMSYIAPLKTEKPCLKCHAKQGYKEGDIKGALAITLPMKGSDEIHSLKAKRSIIYLVTVGVISLVFITVITFILSRRLKGKIDRRIEQDKLTAILELAGAAAHEMRQPMTNIQNLLTISKGKLRDNEAVTEEEMEIVIGQSRRLNEIIKEMLHITRYRTKEYINGKKILDLDESSKDE